MRLPAGRKLFAELAGQTAATLETPANAVIYGDRALYIQKAEVLLYGKHKAFAYVCCDIARKASETIKCLREAEDDCLTEEQTRTALRRKGVFAIISSKDVPAKKVLPMYYLRQYAENMFKISKSNADILPLRVHSERTLRGCLFINFLSVVIYKNMRSMMPKKINLEDALMQMKNMHCKVFEDNNVIPSEPNKKQKDILNAINNTVGRF